MASSLRLLKKAMSVIPTVRFSYRKFAGASVDESGSVVGKYGPWKRAVGFVQPGVVASMQSKNVGEEDYKDMGLDFSRDVVTVWTRADIDNIARDSSPDQINFEGRIFNAVKVSDWLGYDGWRQIVCMEAMNER